MPELPICAKLQRSFAENNLDDGQCNIEFRNPDGPDAAAIIADLYEALDALVSFLRAHVPHFQTYNPLTEDADAALNKARGGSDV